MLITDTNGLKPNAKQKPAPAQPLANPVGTFVTCSSVTHFHSSQLLRRELLSPSFFFLLMKQKLDAQARPTQPAVKVTPCFTS